MVLFATENVIMKYFFGGTNNLIFNNDFKS